MIHIHSLHSFSLFSSLTSLPNYMKFPLKFVCVFPSCPNPSGCHVLFIIYDQVSRPSPRYFYHMPLSSAFLLSPIALWGPSPVLTCHDTYIAITTPINLYSVCMLERQGSAVSFVMLASYSVQQLKGPK